MSLCFQGVYEPEMMWYTWLFEHEGQPRGGATWRGLSQLVSQGGGWETKNLPNCGNGQN